MITHKTIYHTQEAGPSSSKVEELGVLGDGRESRLPDLQVSRSCFPADLRCQQCALFNRDVIVEEREGYQVLRKVPCMPVQGCRGLGGDSLVDLLELQ